MRRVVRSAILLSPIAFFAAAGWAAGCSSDDLPVKVYPEQDGANDVGLARETTPPLDARDAASARCAADTLADGLATHLECTGLYADFATKTVRPDARPFTPGLELWSDGATKSRHLYLPPGTKIDITDFDDWKFPVGTKVWKEFALEGKRIETRLFMKAADNDWKHTTYRWNEAGTDAVRNDAGEKVPSAGGGEPYVIPNVGQCEACHGGRSDRLLGVEAVSLALPSAKGVTVASLAAEGRFDRTPPLTSITIPNDNAGTAAPALGWLHANCGSCHGKAGGISGTTLAWRLRAADLVLPDGGARGAQDLEPWTTAVNKASVRADLDGLSYLRIAGRAPTQSLASRLSGRRADAGAEPNSAVQMPPLVTRRVDVAGHKLLDDWIMQIPAD